MNNSQWGSSPWHDNPITFPCNACNAEPGEPCRPMCLSQVALPIVCLECGTLSTKTWNRYYCSPECIIIHQSNDPENWKQAFARDYD